MRAFIVGAICAAAGAAIGIGGYATLHHDAPVTTTCSRHATGRIEVPSGRPQYVTDCVRSR